MYGTADPAATVNTIVRSNLVPATGDGDYNEDGVVNAADYVAWRKFPSQFGGDPAGYNLWRQNFGETVPGASGQPSAAVPEPASALLLFSALFCSLSLRRPPGRGLRGRCPKRRELPPAV